MFQYLIIILAISATKCDSKCTFVSNRYFSMWCDLIEDIKNTVVEESWNGNIFISSANESQEVNSNSFTTIPDVTRIFFNKSVNNIQPLAFNGLSSLKVIQFEFCDLPIIKNIWFSNLSIRDLVIENCNILSFEEKFLEGSSNITYVFIRFNNISRVINGVFSDTLIEDLELDRNEIINLDENAFANMTNLKILSLSENLLTSFNSSLIMGTECPSLIKLYLSGNKIKDILRNSFVAFPNIHSIFLDGNEVEWIHDGALRGLLKLEYLYLHDNKLQSFNAIAFPPSLKGLALHNNRLNFLSNNFIQYFPKLSEITITGNPWQCSCYKELNNSISSNKINVRCADKYLKGLEPVCIDSETNNDDCMENIPNADALYERYIKKFNNYNETGCSSKYFFNRNNNLLVIRL